MSFVLLEFRGGEICQEGDISSRGQDFVSLNEALIIPVAGLVKGLSRKRACNFHSDSIDDEIKIVTPKTWDSYFTREVYKKIPQLSVAYTYSAIEPLNLSSGIFQIRVWAVAGHCALTLCCPAAT